MTKVLVIDPDKCTSCRLCELACSARYTGVESACPYGVIWCLDEQAHKCDLCGGDPECVRFCAPGALRYERQTLWPQSARQAYADRLRDLAQEVKV